MSAFPRGLAVVLLAALVALPAAPAPGASGAITPAAAAVTAVAASPQITALEAAPPHTFLEGGELAYPEPSFDSAGNIVLAYHDNKTAAFARFNAASLLAITPPTYVTNRTNTEAPTIDATRGPHAALNSRGQLVTAYWDFIDNGTGIRDRVYMNAFNLTGPEAVGEVFVGDSGSYF